MYIYKVEVRTEGRKGGREEGRKRRRELGRDRGGKEQGRLVRVTSDQNSIYKLSY
jgi:hypothetical protein